MDNARYWRVRTCAKTRPIIDDIEAPPIIEHHIQHDRLIFIDDKVAPPIIKRHIRHVVSACAAAT